MLEPQDRVVLLEALKPPEGFTLDEGIGTTFSLDLITLLSTPLAFTMFEWEDAQGELASSPILLLEALRRHIGRLTVFCQVGRIAVPSQPNPLFVFLEGCVVQVAPATSGVFHPKVWALRFVNGETSEVRYRLICLSRNLTDDPSWDLSLVLEGKVVDRRNAFSVNRPLADFVRALPALALRDVPGAVKERVARLAEEILRVDFASELPEPFESHAFHPIGIEGHRASPLPKAWKQGLVISPFIDKTKLNDLSHGTTGSVLVSRQEELDCLPKGALAGWERVYILASSAAGEQEPVVNGDADSEADRPRGLHAKLFLCEDGWDCHVFVGSANATSAAFGQNVEFLVELVGKRSKVGIEQILPRDEDTTGDVGGLRSVLVRYDAPEAPIDDTVERNLDKLLDEVRRAMATAGWVLHAENAGAADWLMRLRRPAGLALPLSDSVTLRAWPVTFLAATSAQPIGPDATEVGFSGAGLGGLTSFLACEVTARLENASRTERFALNLPLVGAPAGRREGVLRQILDDPQKVLRFLQFLLDEESVDLMGDETLSHNGRNGSNNTPPGGFVLLESLLRALAYNPRRLDDVNRLLQELDAGGEDDNRIPTGLREVWPAIWAAREGLRE